MPAAVPYRQRVLEFARLLESTEGAFVSEGAAAQRNPVLHHYVHTLAQLLTEVYAGAVGGNPSRAKLDSFRSRLSALQAVLLPDERPAFCRIGGLAAEVSLPPLASRGGGGAPSARGGPAGAAPPSLGAGLLPLPPPPPPPQQQQQQQQRLQETLTDDMVALAARIKQNALAMESAVREGDGVLDTAASLLDRNVAAASSTASAATEAYAAAARSSWLTWGLLLLVGLVFAAVYMLIKLTAGTAARGARGEL